MTLLIILDIFYNIHEGEKKLLLSLLLFTVIEIHLKKKIIYLLHRRKK